MGLLDIVLDPVQGLLGTDTTARIPGLNALTGAKTDEAKALLKKQEELAKEADLQRKRNAQMRMQALGQSMLAFNPQNQMMAQMFGPQAAFSPQQMAEMASDPGARSRADYDAAHAQAMQQPWQDRRMQGWSADDLKRMEDNERRKKMIEQQMAPLGPGPAPLNLPPPAAARRY